MGVNEIFYGTKYGEVGVAVAPAESGEVPNAGTMCHLTTLKIFTDKKALTTAAKLRDDGSIDPTQSTDSFTNINVNVTENNTFGIKLRADGTPDPLKSDLTANTVEIDDNPTNTYGLASKIYLYKTILNHSYDPDAHSEIFNNIIATFTDLYEKKGEFRVASISDPYKNVLYANGKYIAKGDETHPKYIVLSSDKNRNYDDLVRRVEELEAKVNQLETN